MGENTLFPGAFAEWMAAAVAGVALYPTTTGGRTALIWPRFPKSAATLQYASAIQGTARGDFAIAWRFERLPINTSNHNSAFVTIRIRFLIPPSAAGALRLPIPVSTKTQISLRHALFIPNVTLLKASANNECNKRREARLGFPYSWEYNMTEKQWYKLESKKKIGTPCNSFLFHPSLNRTKWSDESDITNAVSKRLDQSLGSGFYEIVLDNWKLEKEIEGSGRIGNIPEYFNSKNLGPYCSDGSTFEWHIDDATHII